MFRPFPLFVGLRYFRAKRRNQFISFISGMSLVSIAIGVMALITVLSVMNGFQDELRDRILNMTSDATISGFDNKLSDWPAVMRDAQELPSVTGAAPYVDDQAMLANGSNMSGTEVRGVIPSMEPAVSEVGKRMVMGKLDELQPGSYGIVLGKDLAYALGVAPGDKVILMISQGNVTPAGLIPRFRRFTVTGIFDAGMYEYDRGLALINIKDAQVLYGLGDQVSGLRLKVKDKYQAPLVARALTERFHGAYYVSDWTQEHVNFFKAIAMEKTVMFIILSLIELVAAISIAITLDGGDRQAGGHRHPAHPGRQPTRDHGRVHRAGHHHRLPGHAHRLGAGGAAGHLPERHHAFPAAGVPHGVPALQRVLHQRPAGQHRAQRRAEDHPRQLRAHGAVHAVSRLARRQHPAGGGLAL